MKSIIISNVTNALSSVLSHQQLKSLLDALNLSFIGYDVVKIETSLEDNSKKLIDSFLAAKKIEGSSEKTIKYYRNTINSVMDEIGKQIVSINTDDIRLYLSNYQEKRKVSNVTIDNVRRILSSFFSWLEDENYILKNPIRRIHKVKTAKIIKEALALVDIDS